MFRFVKRLLLIVGLFLAGVVGLLHFAVLQGDPLVASMSAPVPEDVVRTREFVKNLRTTVSEGGANVQLTGEQLQSSIRLGARFAPGFRGMAQVGRDVVIAEGSVPLPWITGRRWLNVSAMIPEFTGKFQAAHVQVGAVSIPPDLAVWLARVGGNVVLGDGAGDGILDIPKSMTIAEGALNFQVEMANFGENNLFGTFFESMRGGDLPTPQEVVTYEEMLFSAMEDGRLSQSGPYLPYLVFLLDAVADQSTDETLANNYTAAILALAKVCGARDFHLVIGGIAFDENAQTKDASCDELLFNNRIDSRRHFTTAAALQAASNRGFSVSVGEFKELHDTVRAGGFDFTDLAANNSGIRLSDVIMESTVDELRTLRDRMIADNSVIIPFDDLPQIMSGDEFEARFGDVNSPAYQEMLAEIEAKIDALPIYQ